MIDETMQEQAAAYALGALDEEQRRLRWLGAIGSSALLRAREDHRRANRESLSQLGVSDALRISTG